MDVKAQNWQVHELHLRLRQICLSGNPEGRDSHPTRGRVFSLILRFDDIIIELLGLRVRKCQWHQPRLWANLPIKSLLLPIIINFLHVFCKKFISFSFNFLFVLFYYCFSHVVF
uniref:Uncharacterized protein n=1 Tax=Cacopsylla melanoneura TaxID=428564 RepID=A0A8D8VHH0_9HEMI